MQLMPAEQKEVETASDALARLMGSCAVRGASLDTAPGPTQDKIRAAISHLRVTVESYGPESLMALAYLGLEIDAEEKP